MPPTDPGFDLPLVQAGLFDWLVTKGVATPDMDAIDAAMNHIELHGLHLTQANAETSNAEILEPCSLSPCKALGVALALWEITAARLDSERDLVGLIHGLEELSQELSRVESLSRSNMLEPVRREAVRLNEVRRRTPGLLDVEYFDMVCRAPSEILLALAGAKTRSESLVQVLRTYVESSTGDHSGRGRPAQPLLAAVTQHLHANGFTYEQIAQMVPDGTVGDADAAWERVRKRVKGPDQRRLVSHGPAAAPSTEGGGNKPP